MTSSEIVIIKMQTGGKHEPDGSNKDIIGVSLISDCEGRSSTNIGVCLISKEQLISCKVSELRDVIKKEVLACPSNFLICTKQGWPLTGKQETDILVNQIINDKQEVLIKIKHDKPKCGVKDKQGNMIGFVHVNYSASLTDMKNLIQSQVLNQDISNIFQFLDGNSWPISILQEQHMTVYDILIGQCVFTDINSNNKSKAYSPPPKEPPLKKFKSINELSFRSGKDVFRQLSSDTNEAGSTYKQVLISYVRSEAADHALRLKQQLTTLGLSVYLDVHEIQTGVDWQDSLNFAVSGCEVFVPLVTQKYGETQWTNREVKLADVLGKYILPVNFLPDWPPRCLAIQFATTQFIPWIPPTQLTDRTEREGGGKVDWTLDDIKVVSQKIVDRVRGLNLRSVPSLVKRATIVKSCACVTEDNMMAITSGREGKPLIMICVHYTQEVYGGELKTLLEEEGFEVWCTTELDREHVNHIDGLASSQDDITYSVLNKGNDKFAGCPGDSIARNIELFQEKADDASLVLFVLSNDFSMSRVCQQQVFYCEHRKHVIPILFEDFKMPDWMSMLVGSHGFEMRSDEDFMEILIRRVKATINETLHSSSPRSMRNNLRARMNGSGQVDGNILSTLERQSSETFSPQSELVHPVFATSESSISRTGRKNGTLSSKKKLDLNDYDLENVKHSSDVSSSSETIEDVDDVMDDRPSLSSMKTIIL
ncbi:uncharacterized protein LOC132719139 [Ruditapes philippinarum]|uniref:uncharacterized protein LOC132719139 n=1 Tax=Ruditapes philippinarum TaxID=129788 RepID=UPI00295B521F|nr:uncharacterized protein LOC132719139 [Ruditapes philippinarum]